MKKAISLLLFIYLFISGISAQYVTKTFSFGGLSRSYLLHVPASYDGSTPYALVIALHGLGDNMNNFKNVGFHLLADTAKFFVVVPQAIVDVQLTNQTAWNSGAGAFGISLNPTIDDVGFLNAIIDSTAANYNLNQQRVYATGFSMGGFMSNRLACELSNRIAAIASVSGTIGGSLTCTPTRHIPVAHFHGTADATVAYTNNNFGNDPEELVTFWVGANQCDVNPIIDSLPDTKVDGKTIIKYSHKNGADNTEVEFFKVVGGAHEWLVPSTNDISYTHEIWRFFRRFEWTEQTQVIEKERSNVMVYPNPAEDFISTEIENATIRLINNNGQPIREISGGKTMSIQGISPGFYVVEVLKDGQTLHGRVLIK